MNDIRGIVSVGGRVVSPAPIEKRGLKGNGIDHITLNADYTLSIYYTNGTVYTTAPIRGQQGETGNGIASIEKTGTSGLVDTYTITFTDGSTTTFNVTNGSNDWDDITNKPETFPPSSHTHDDRYYTETEVEAKNYATQSWVEAKGYLTEHQSLSAYRTSAAQDTIDASKQDTLTAGTLVDITNNTISIDITSITNAEIDVMFE